MSRRVTGFDPVVTGAGVALLVRYPWLSVVLLAGTVLRRWRVGSTRRADLHRAGLDAVTLGQVVYVGLTGGLSLVAALSLALGEVGTLVGREINNLLRAARREGMAAALLTSTGSLTRPLFSRLALAQSSGAPMGEAVAAFLIESRQARRSQALERIRRLPVALMVPLGLLILPGFVTLFVGPIVLTSVIELAGSLP